MWKNILKLIPQNRGSHIFEQKLSAPRSQTTFQTKTECPLSLRQFSNSPLLFEKEQTKQKPYVVKSQGQIAYGAIRKS